MLNFPTESFTWDRAVPAGQWQIAKTVECVLILMQDVPADLPKLMAGLPRQ